MTRTLDLIVYGATGFTGRLVAEFLQATHGQGGLSWALAGRSAHKLADTRDAIGASRSLPLIEADADDADALARMAARAHVVITTVGPYQRHGRLLAEACARAGTDYVDLCGEPTWMAQMIPHLQAPAAASGARIVFSCGFDSIPFDLGVVFLQQQAMERLGAPLRRVHGLVKVMKGGISGGTLASAMDTFEAVGRDPAAARVMADPFALTPGFRGPPQPDGGSARYDELAGAWTGPFMMAAINTKNVHRTNALRGHPWGLDFEYDERALAADELRARLMAGTAQLQDSVFGIGPVRRLLGRFMLPQPGQGPTKAQRDRGRFELLFIGQSADGRVLRARVTGDRDPGYGSTAKMISESALCLRHDIDRSVTAGGVWTPGAAMGLRLVRRLEAHAGLGFSIVGDGE